MKTYFVMSFFLLTQVASAQVQRAFFASAHVTDTEVSVSFNKDYETNGFESPLICSGNINAESSNMPEFYQRRFPRAQCSWNIILEPTYGEELSLVKGTYPIKKIAGSSSYNDGLGNEKLYEIAPGVNLKVNLNCNEPLLMSSVTPDQFGCRNLSITQKTRSVRRVVTPEGESSVTRNSAINGASETKEADGSRSRESRRSSVER